MSTLKSQIGNKQLDPVKKLLVQEWLNNYLTNCKTDTTFKYMDFSITENSGYIYIKVTDKARSDFYLLNGSYYVNTHILLREPSIALYNIETEDKLKEYLSKSFDKEKFLVNFKQSLTGEKSND